LQIYNSESENDLSENKLQCKCENPTTGTQCGLPVNHSGQHQNGTLCRPWDDEKKESKQNAVRGTSDETRTATAMWGE
jgi:hypothetical protein